MPRPAFSAMRRALSLSIALLIATWANLDLAAFHGPHASATSALTSRAAPAVSGSTAPAARLQASHDANHQCAFASVAHASHDAPFTGARAALSAARSFESAEAVAPRIPGRTASGLAPPA